MVKSPKEASEEGVRIFAPQPNDPAPQETPQNLIAYLQVSQVLMLVFGIAISTLLNFMTFWAETIVLWITNPEYVIDDVSIIASLLNICFIIGILGLVLYFPRLREKFIRVILTFFAGIAVGLFIYLSLSHVLITPIIAIGNFFFHPSAFLLCIPFHISLVIITWKYARFFTYLNILIISIFATLGVLDFSNISHILDVFLDIPQIILIIGIYTGLIYYAMASTRLKNGSLQKNIAYIPAKGVKNRVIK